MTDLTFESDVRWKGRGREGAGTVVTGGQELVYSAPGSMGGKGVGTSPEGLLVSAVASCFTSTLFHLLVRDGLPVDDVAVHAAGVVTDYPSRAARVSKVVVNPTITGADSTRLDEYQASAQTAREHCFIGKALRDTIRYEVGAVSLCSPALMHVEIA